MRIKFPLYLTFLFLVILSFACKKENISESAINIPEETTKPIIPNKEIVIDPIDINVSGFDFMEQIQGHWIGINRVIADDFPWFAFDFRAISESHVHGIFEGGTMGNLLTSFFVTDFKGKRTIMARNGGLLNGIYRSSYFVLDSVGVDNSGDFYRFIDAYGGIQAMSMELKFSNDSLYFNAYTSRLGASVPPSRHMTFKGVKSNEELANTAATALGYPKNTPAFDFSNGFKKEDLWINIGETEPKSATFLDYDKDPWTIENHPYLSYLQVDVTHNSNTTGSNLLVYLSKESLTDQQGYFNPLRFETDLLKFPELVSSDTRMLFTYLHPGTYYITVIADKDGDGSPSFGDYSNISQKQVVGIEAQDQVTIDQVTTLN